MSVHVVSLISKVPQVIPPNEYTLLKFPYEGESYDKFMMHSQPSGLTDWQTDSRSGLIYPSKDGWGILEANIFWESRSYPNGYTKLCDRFDRNPLEYNVDPTAYEHRNPCSGMQCIVKVHTMFVYTGVSLGVRVKHNDIEYREVTQAQLKLTIMDVDGG